jgi:hypothetical protein
MFSQSSANALPASLAGRHCEHAAAPQPFDDRFARDRSQRPSRFVEVEILVICVHCHLHELSPAEFAGVKMSAPNSLRANPAQIHWQSARCRPATRHRLFASVLRLSRCAPTRRTGCALRCHPPFGPCCPAAQLGADLALAQVPEPEALTWAGGVPRFPANAATQTNPAMSGRRYAGMPPA